MAEMTDEQLIERLRDAQAEQGLRIEELTAERDALKAEVERLRADQAKAANWEARLASKLQHTEEVARSWEEAARAMEKRAQQAETERDEAQRVAATLRASRNEIRTKLNEALHAAEAQRNRLAERLAAFKAHVFARFVDADIEGSDLNAMTVDQLTEMVTTGWNEVKPDAG